ncbi:MAG TPA: SLC13 family permease [Acidimicrobiales bacterium]|nr:SLC13 family permease [Acidimicrobiales bacterium]
MAPSANLWTVGRFRLILLCGGVVGAVAATLSDPGRAQAAAAQDSPAFLLVAGLLLIGLVAQQDHLFETAGRWLSDRFQSDGLLLAMAMLLIGVVTATLNLDTSVAFLTPVLVQAGRQRPALASPLLYGCVLLANAGSLLLPGSNLTNLIVLGPLHISGVDFLRRMSLPWAAALLITGAGVWWWGRRAPSASAGAGAVVAGSQRPSPVAARRVHADVNDGRARPAVGLGLVGIAGAIGLVLAVRSPALPVLGLGLALILWRLARRRVSPGAVLEVLDLPVLIGLLGVAVGLGALARTWTGPAQLMGHLNSWASAGLAAAASVAVNNLPAASLLGAGRLAHPYSVLVGLDLGPNLMVSGSLAWIIWLRTARQAGAEPSIGRAVRLGAATAPLAMAAAVLMLWVTGPT